MTRLIYLDHNASTPPAAEVVDAMLPWLGNRHANPHAEHLHGHLAAQAISDAKGHIANLVGADSDDVVLTSGATESNNLVLQGLLGRSGNNRLLIVSAIEHPSILATADVLESRGARVVRIAVDRGGKVRLDQLEATLADASEPLKVISIMHANNEIGTVQHIREIGRLTHEFSGLLHVDAVQSAGKVPINTYDDGIDFLTISAHKLYGPVGIGALCASPDMKGLLQPIMFGGGQQEGIRPGTIPVFLAVGFGMACQLATSSLHVDAVKLRLLEHHFLSDLRVAHVDCTVLGDQQAKLPGTLSIAFAGANASDLLLRLQSSISAATGSACAAGEIKSSHVLRALGLSEEDALSVVRFGFGRGNSLSDIRQASEAIVKALNTSQSAHRSEAC